MHTTLRIPDDIADMIANRVRPTRGSVPGYAAELAILFAQLTPNEEAEVRTLVEEKIRRRAVAPEPVLETARR